MAVRASRPWKRAVVTAIAIHAVLITLAVRSVRITSPSPESRAVDIQLVQLRPPPPHRQRPPSAKTTPAPSPSAAAPAAPAPVAIAPAPTTTIPAQTSSSDGDLGRIRAMLRGSVGCSSAAFLKLTKAEQAACETRVARGDPHAPAPLAIDPVKTSWYERDMQYRKAGRYMPIGPPGHGVEVTPGLPPGHYIAHIGPIGIGLPPGAFNDDDAPPP
jgi:hypothetical protein